VLILTHGTKRTVHLSARNIPGILVRPWGEASAYELLWADRIVVEDSALSAEPDAGAGEDDE
jgi:ribosomal protein L4